jgi:hypothetical protein
MLTGDQISQRSGNLSLSKAVEELGKFDSYSRTDNWFLIVGEPGSHPGKSPARWSKEWERLRAY